MNNDSLKDTFSAADILNNELSDDQLDSVVGGVGVGDTVLCSKSAITYCSKCGKLLKNYEAVIVGVRGVLDGKTVYWVTRKCCGIKTSLVETEITG